MLLDVAVVNAVQVADGFEEAACELSAGGRSGIQPGAGGRGEPVIILDMDSSMNPTHGDQSGSAYNGYFGCTCYHPLFGSTSLVTWSEASCVPQRSQNRGLALGFRARGRPIETRSAATLPAG